MAGRNEQPAARESEALEQVGAASDHEDGSESSSWLSWPGESDDDDSSDGGDDALILDTRRAIEEYDAMLAESNSKEDEEATEHQNQPQRRGLDGRRIRTLSSRIRDRIKSSGGSSRRSSVVSSGETSVEEYTTKTGRASADSLPDMQTQQRSYHISASLHSELGVGQQHQQHAASDPPSRNLSRDEIRTLARKTGAAVAGGSLIALSVPLLPLPGPGAEVMCIGGMAVLAKEFPAAQKVLDGTRDKLVEVLDKTAPADDCEDKKGKGEADGNMDSARSEGRHVQKLLSVSTNRYEASTDDGLIISATNLSQPCAQDAINHRAYADGGYFHLHEEVLPQKRHVHHGRHNYHHYHHRNCNHHHHHGGMHGRRRRNKTPSKIKKSLHRSVHGLGTNIVVPLLNTVCTEREGTSGGTTMASSTRKAIAGARSCIASTFRSLSEEAAAGWREVEEEYARVAALEAEAQQEELRRTIEAQRARAEAAAAATSKSVLQKLMEIEKDVGDFAIEVGDAILLERKEESETSGASDYDCSSVESNGWDTESCPNDRPLEAIGDLWDTVSCPF